MYISVIIVYFSNYVLYFAIICCLFFESGKTRGAWFTVQILVVVMRQRWWRALTYLSLFCNLTIIHDICLSVDVTLQWQNMVRIVVVAGRQGWWRAISNSDRQSAEVKVTSSATFAHPLFPPIQPTSHSLGFYIDRNTIAKRLAMPNYSGRLVAT